MNRGLNVGLPPGMASTLDPATHTFVLTTNADGSLKATYSWGNSANPTGWNLNQREDVRAAEEALKLNPRLRSLVLEKVGDADLDPFIDKAYDILDQHGTKHNNRLVSDNCKSEANRLITVAKWLRQQQYY